MEQQVDHFYDEDTGMFIINPEVKMAHVLGEDVDNPKATFRKIENIFDNRINLLSKAFFDIRKIADAQVEESNGLNKEIDDNFDNIENELYYKIKTLFSDFEKQNDQRSIQLSSNFTQSNIFAEAIPVGKLRNICEPLPLPQSQRAKIFNTFICHT